MLLKIDKIMDQLLTYICMILISSITLLVALQIVSRYIVNSPLGWTEEISRYLMAWFAFMGTPLALLTSSHIVVHLFSKDKKNKFTRMLGFLEFIGLSIFSVFMLTKGIYLTVMNWEVTITSLDMSIGAWLYLAVPISALLIIIVLLLKVAKYFFPAAANQKS